MNNKIKIDIDDLVDQALDDGGTFEYADTLPALRYNVKNWIEEYLDDNDIDYKLTKKDIKLINSLVKDFYDDNVDEGYHRRKSYSIQEALRELKGSKKIIEKVEDSDAEFPDSFEDIVDFLKADEEEAIKGYEKALDKVEDEFVKDQLDKINTEEKAHKAYLDKVVEDPAVEYTEPLEDEEDEDESVTSENVEKNTIEEAFKLLRMSKKKINEDTKKFEDKDAEEEYFRHIQELSTDYEDPNAEDDYEDYDEEDIEESCTLKESNDIVTAVFKDNGFDKSEFEEAYPELMSRLEFDTREFDDRENQLAYCDIYVKGKREDVEEFIQKSIWDYGCDTKEEAEELYGEGCIPTIVNESLNEDAKFVTAATILKKERHSIFAQPTEEGMRKMVLSILDKNKDKMKPENYNAVVKTMTNCPKRAVPSTVWTMLNPSQKVGK